MNSALLEETREDLAPGLVSPGFCSEVDGDGPPHADIPDRSPSEASDWNRPPGGEPSTLLRLRARSLLTRRIEYIDSPCFRESNAEQEILGPFPTTDSAAGTTPPADTPPYVAALYHCPLLTREQERYLFRRMNYLKFRADRLRRGLDPDDPQPELIDRIERDLAEALSIRNHIVCANLRLVVSIAKKVVDAANSFDELVSDGNVPLIRAVEIFDFERGTRFSTYATWAIRNSLYRSTPRNRKRRTRFRLGCEMVFASLSDPRGLPHEQESFHRELRQSLERMLSKLDDRDRTIVVDRFGLNETGRPKRFREIAEKLNISTERVRQLLARSLDRLHQLAEKEPIEAR